MAALTEFIQDGIRYVPTKAIAKSVGLSPDYLSRFCRTGLVRAVFHKGAWYVNEASLHTFLADQAKQREAYQRKLSEEARQEVERTRAASAPSAPPARAPITVRPHTALAAPQITRRTQPAYLLVGMVAALVILGSTAFALSVPEKLAHIIGVPARASAQFAAAASSSWFDTLADNFYNTICPYFTDCELDFATTEKIETQQLPSQPQPTLATSTPTRASAVASAQPIQQTVINQPVIERVVERVHTEVGGNVGYVDLRIGALRDFLLARMAATDEANATSFRSVALGGGGSSSSVAASSITGTLTNVIDSALGTILDLTTNTLVATNASTTNLTVSATTTTGTLAITQLDCSSLGNGGTLTTDASGTVVCAADDGGAGSSVGGATTQVQFNDAGSFAGDGGFTYDKTNDRATLVNASTTNLTSSYASTSALVVSGTFVLGTVTAGTWNGAAIGDAYLTKSGNWTGTFDGQEGSFYLANSFATTSANYWQTTRNFFSTTSADYWETQQAARTADDLTNNSIEDLSDVAAITENYGDLFAWNGSAWADFATSSLAIALSDTTGTLGATRGGTGLSSVSAAGILVGNYAGTGWQQLATSTLGLLTTHVAEGANLYYTDARVQSFVHASSTIPKTYTANTFTGLQTFTNASTTNLSASYASSTQGFFGSLSVGSLSGFLKATAGAVATAAIDLANDVTGILAVARGGTGWGNLASGAIVLGNGTGPVATTSAGTNGQILALLNGTPSWVATSTLSTISGTLAVTQGGTGLTAYTLGDVLYASGATSLAGTSTASLKQTLALNNVENTALSTWAGSSNLTTLGTLSALTVSGNTSLSNATTSFLFVKDGLSSNSAAFGGTATSSFSTSGALTLASALSVSNGGTGQTSFGQGWLNSNGTTISASTSPTVNYIVATSTNATSTFAAGMQTTALNVTSSSATSTFANGIRLSSGCFQMPDGSCAGTSGASLTGTTGQLPYFSGTNSAVGTSTLFLSSAGFFGIGTTTPVSALTIYGDTLFNGTSRYANFGTTTGSLGYGFRDNAGTLEFKNSGGAWQGVTTATSGPAFRVHKNGANQTVTANTQTLLTWSDEEFDTNNNFDLSNERFTPTVPGKYMIVGQAACIASGGGWAIVYVAKNGTVVASDADYSASPRGPNLNAGAIVDMNGASDYVTAEVYCGGTTIDGAATLTNFSGALIAPVSATAGGWQNDNTQSILADATDLVGIGTSTPWGKLSIQNNYGSALTSLFTVGSSTAANGSTASTFFTITNTGNVGIGTTSPWAQLSVNAAAGTNSFAIGSSTATYFLVDKNGNVGIGTTTPSSSLGGSTSGLVVGSSAARNGVTIFGSVTGSDAAFADLNFFNNGARMSLIQAERSGANNSSNLVFYTSNAGVIGAGMKIDPSGNVAINASGQVGSGKLGVAFASGFRGIDINNTDATNGRGFAGFLSNGSVIGSISNSNNTATAYNTSSDRRIKENIATTTLGLDTLMRLSVREFSFKSDATHATTTGFIAQELQQVFPWAVTTNGDNGLDPLGASSTPWSVDYGRITPLLAKSIQDLNLKLENLSSTSSAQAQDENHFTTRFFSSLFTHLTQWFADATNGIGELYARVFKGERVETQELCVDDVCVTRDEFLRMKEGQSAAAGASSMGIEAPSGSSAAGSPSADTSTTTTSTDDATTTVESRAPMQADESAANDYPQPQGAEQSLHDDNQPVTAETAPVPEVQPAQTEPVSIPEPANDNVPAELSATGTD